jgi:uncharacterized membrane protein
LDKERAAVQAPTVQAQYVGLNGHIAASITKTVGTMWAFYLAAVFQFGWIALAEAGVITFDPYPFAFLLFIFSLLQLILMFVIMVGQDVLAAQATSAPSTRSWTPKPSCTSASGCSAT